MAHPIRGTRFAAGRQPGGRLPPPSQLPNVYNKLQYDFAFDPSAANSSAQHSSLVLGYVYRSYTANSGSIGLRYFW